MRIGIFTDLHANLPALKRILAFFANADCDMIYHVGDMIGIGPYPRECLDLANKVSNLIPIMGNHDYWYASGLPSPQPAWMSDEEVAHQRWTHLQLQGTHREWVQQWPFSTALEKFGLRIEFRHYALNEDKSWFRDFIKNPTAKDFDDHFDDVDADLVFHGHDHQCRELVGRKRYINPGSAGCYDRPEARVAILDIEKENYRLELHSLTYDDDGLMEAFDNRLVPARDFIRKAFITRNG